MEHAPTAAPVGSLEARLARLTARPLFWIAIILTVAAIPTARAILAARSLPPPKPVLGKVPHFALTDANGETFDSERLEGKVWVANAIFTRCPTICPSL